MSAKSKTAAADANRRLSQWIKVKPDGTIEIAKAINVDPRTVQRRIAAMEKATFLRREERRGPTGSKTNIYHFDGLIEAAKPFAEEKLADIAERVAVKKARSVRRGKPTLKVVK